MSADGSPAGTPRAKRVDAAVARIERAAARLLDVPEPPPTPAQIVTRAQVLDLLRPFDDHPETVSYVDMGTRVTDVVRRQMSSERLAVPLCAALGLDPHRVTHLRIEPTRITVTEYVLDDQGATVRRGDELATVTTTIGIQ